MCMLTRPSASPRTRARPTTPTAAPHNRGQGQDRGSKARQGTHHAPLRECTPTRKIVRICDSRLCSRRSPCSRRGMRTRWGTAKRAGRLARSRYVSSQCAAIGVLVLMLAFRRIERWRRLSDAVREHRRRATDGRGRAGGGKRTVCSLSTRRRVEEADEWTTTIERWQRACSHVVACPW